MGRTGEIKNTGHSTFTPSSGEGTTKKKKVSSPPTMSSSDIVSKAKKKHDPLQPPARVKDSCCPAQDRLSSWFSGMGGCGKFLFGAFCVLTAGIGYLVTLVGFAMFGEDNG